MITQSLPDDISCDYIKWLSLYQIGKKWYERMKQNGKKSNEQKVTSMLIIITNNTLQ